MTDGIVVVGGFGGTAARLEDMHRAAAALRAAADRLDEASTVLAAAVRTTWTAPDPFVSGAAVRTALGPLVSSPSSPGRAAENLRRLARGLVESAAGYARAESMVSSAVRGVLGVVGTVIGESPIGLLMGLGVVANGLAIAGAGTLLSRQVTGRWPEQTAIVRSGAAEPLLFGGATSLRALQPGFQRPVEQPVGPAVGPLASALRDRSLLVAPVLGGTRTLVGSEVPASDGDAMRIVRDAYDTHGAEPGEVVVTRLDHPDGTRSWIVAIPGTEEWTLGGANPLDLQSNLELMAGHGASASDLAIGAMEQAGIPGDEPVLLAGHSQGGINAMALAGSAAVASRFTITHVLTAGSPVAGMSARPGIEVTSVEHTDDLVPALDAHPNPDTPARVTVVRDLAASDDVVDRTAHLTLAGTHDVDLYARTLDLVGQRASDDASLRAWRDSVGATIYGPDGTTATSTAYTGVAGVVPAR